VFKIGAPYPDLSVRGAMLDITDLVANDPLLGDENYFFPFESTRSSLNDRWYGIGSTFQWRLLYCNQDLLDAAGIAAPSTDPEQAWTWEEFLDIATQLTIDASGKHPGDDGFDPQNVVQWGFFAPDAFYDNYVFSNGGTIIDSETMQFALDRPEAYEAVQAFADLRLVHNVAAQAAVLEQMGMNAWQMLASGRVAIIQDGNWALQDIAKMGMNFSVGVLPMLQQPATVTSSSWTSIYANTAHPEESWQLLRYLNSDEYQVGLVRAGLWGVSHQSLLTPEGVETWWNTEVHPENWLPLETEYKFNYGHVTPNVVGMQRTLGMITQSMADVWIGNRTAQDVLTELTPRLNQTLAEEQARV
jgi:multiple sugar transport system substrate-binding protein